MRQKRFLLFMLLAVAVSLAAVAQSFSLVQPRNVIEGRNFNITFRLSDSEGNPPAAPQLEGCTLLYGPSTSTMQSTQIINGKMTSSYSIDFSFVYRADKAGDVQIPSVSINADGKTLHSKPASFKILPPDRTQSQGNSNASSGQQQSGGVSAPESGRISSDDLLVRVFFSKSSVYEQEPVVATIKVYTKFDISSFLVTTQPAFEGFLTEELPVDMETSIEHYNGQNYHTAVLKRLLLYPQRSGKLSVNSGKYDVTIVQYETVNMGFFRTQRPVEREVTTSSNAASLQVNPLPEPKPAGFNGAVGVFTVDTRLDTELLRTNEAAVYSYIIKGRGNIKYLSEPSVQFPAGIDVYTPKTDIEANIIGGGTNMSGAYTTDFTFVPQEVGNFTIDGTDFVYFNPETKKYVTVDVPDMPIKVLKGNSSAAAVEQKNIDNTINDILHIHPVRPGDQQMEVTYHFRSTYYWLAYVIVALVLIGLIVIYRRHIRLEADVVGRKLAKASRVATKRLKAARGFMDRHENDKFYAALSGALWGYMSDKLSIPASQLTRENISSKLEAYGVSEDKIKDVLDVLDRCEMARFTPTHSDDEVAELYSKATQVINNIENTKKR